MCSRYIEKFLLQIFFTMTMVSPGVNFKSRGNSKILSTEQNRIKEQARFAGKFFLQFRYRVV